MNIDREPEHFCTLFDKNFLPLALTLHQSLMEHARPFHLWVLCMDEVVEEQLKSLSVPHVTLIALREIETEDLLSVKQNRTAVEYCWTITPFLPQAVFDRNGSVDKITYLDADLYFFADPRILIREFDQSGKDVLITEHAYAPEYDQTPISGRFCVQFLTFRRTPGANNVMRWWQQRCLEWCFARPQAGKFGDQKYLDSWPDLFGENIHILKQAEKTLAPWNVRHVGGSAALDPVFYHFHDLRIISPQKVRMYRGYRIGKKGMRLYEIYMAALKGTIGKLSESRVPVATLPKKEKWATLRYLKRRLTNSVGYAPL